MIIFDIIIEYEIETDRIESRIQTSSKAALIVPWSNRNDV